MDGIRIGLEHVSKTFGAVTALADVGLAFEPGILHGVIGSDGAGKTTLMRCIAGLLTPSGGSIRFIAGGAPVPFSVIRPSLAYMPARQVLYHDLSIDEHLQFFRELYGLPAEAFRQKAEELLEITRLAPFRARSVGKLSGGMYKKVGLMCAMLQSPSVLLLDEPTNGVDPISRREFWELLYRLLRQNILIVMSTAYMDEAERCGRVHLIDGGRVVASGEPACLLAERSARSFDELFLRAYTRPA